MDSCQVEEISTDTAFDDLLSEMQGDLYWYRFFARPCCPAPDLEGAR